MPIILQLVFVTDPAGCDQNRRLRGAAHTEVRTGMRRRGVWMLVGNKGDMEMVERVSVMIMLVMPKVNTLVVVMLRCRRRRGCNSEV